MRQLNELAPKTVIAKQVCVRTGQGFEMVQGTIGWRESCEILGVRCDTARILKYRNECANETDSKCDATGARTMKKII